MNRMIALVAFTAATSVASAQPAPQPPPGTQPPSSPAAQPPAYPPPPTYPGTEPQPYPGAQPAPYPGAQPQPYPAAQPYPGTQPQPYPAYPPPGYVEQQPPAPPLEDLYATRPFKISLHLMPASDSESSSDSQPVRPFGQIGAAFELALSRNFAIEAGLGWYSNLHLAAFGHARLPVSRHVAIGVAPGFSRGHFHSSANAYNCRSTGIIFTSTTCDYANRSIDSALWSHLGGELEYRHERLHGIAFRLMVGVSFLLGGEQIAQCTNGMGCETHSDEVDAAPFLTLSAGYTFGS